MRRALSTFTVALMAACTSGCSSVDDPIGPEIWSTFGGLCDGPCSSRRLYRDELAVEFRRTDGGKVKKVRHGLLTDEGFAEYEAASAELVVGHTLETCGGADGVDARASVLTGDGTFQITYCVLGTIDPDVARLDTFFTTVMNGLDECTSNAWVDAC